MSYRIIAIKRYKELMMTMDYRKNSDLLKALAHPVRLQMAVGLLANECHVDKMVQKLNLPQSTVSQHLGILRNQGILEVRKEGVKTCYRVINPKVIELLKILLK
jgi:DNA-binding transcriptional ArsR family regulator